MAKEQGLKTLGDYRRTAKNSLFNPGLKPNNKDKDAFFCDAIKTALSNCRSLIIQSRIDPSIPGAWEGIIYPNSEYEMRNLPLFNSIKLMEFAINYKDKAESFNKLAPNWPFRPDVNAMVFTSAGVSYLEAAFNFVHELGKDIIGILQNAYKKHNKEGNIVYFDPFKFLNKTPQVDKLKINPVPDIIIKTWYDSILVGVRNYFPENEFSKQKLEAEFNKTHRQLGYERDVWKNGETPDEEHSLPLFTKQWAYIFGVSRNKMRELRESNQYHFHQVSKRKWSLPKKELPTEYLEKYRNANSK